MVVWVHLSVGNQWSFLMDDSIFVICMCDDSSDQGHLHTYQGNNVKDNKDDIMRKFTKEDYDLVKKYEKDFTRAIESRYCTGLLKEELEVISGLYKETLNRQANLSCGGCVLQMMTSVGRLYFAFAKKMSEVKEEVKDNKENKPKRRRRKKNETEVESQIS
jgi:hypothetical protein